ncbi:uncharacterized protein PITG_16886 [Phytophthora infestans T30-4]|uniref:Uncharacterized protein n=1 Tax=Phytophthora infestans (strain T30-4) TaxID=403677 RepID=D0NUB8_PHYIT|nr:uncharacterized protein PITG_16886 [Phytophthora infestans T30-4]EEY65251.1 hypothetical protein PITG_16886 [Phytophthora infestans T30-4]|eukprot:XP_002897315.1 hypothetical protein PITG_16886 [Phytophthora infestans T30-4]
MTRPGEKTFKQLWRDLCKEGWIARKPSGMAPSVSAVRAPARGPIGKEASYTAIEQQPPSVSVPVKAASRPSSPLPVVIARPEPFKCSAAAPSLHGETNVTTEAAVSASKMVQASTTDDTEQVDVGGTAIPDDTELPRGATTRSNEVHEDEGKSDCEEVQDRVDFDVFDSDSFVKGLRQPPARRCHCLR